MSDLYSCLTSDSHSCKEWHSTKCVKILDIISPPCQPLSGDKNSGDKGIMTITCVPSHAYIKIEIETISYGSVEIRVHSRQLQCRPIL